MSIAQSLGAHPAARMIAAALRSRRYIIEVLRVSGTSRPNSVAGAIAAILRTDGRVEVQAIGANAVNQAVKSIAVARSYIEADGLDLATVPAFVKLELENEERTALRFTVTSSPLEANLSSDGEGSESREGA